MKTGAYILNVRQSYGDIFIIFLKLQPQKLYLEKHYWVMYHSVSPTFSGFVWLSIKVTD